MHITYHLFPQSERDAVGAFLQHLVELAAFELERTPIATPLSPQLRQLLARLFLCDYECNYFLNTYGAVSQVRGAAIDRCRAVV